MNAELQNTKCLVCCQTECSYDPKYCRPGFSISPAGFLIVYELGAMATLKNYGYIDYETPLAGSSAGALLSVLIGIGISPRLILRTLYIISDRCRAAGTRGKLKDELLMMMEDLVHEGTVDILNKRKGAITVGYTRVSMLIRMKGEYVRKFNNVQDLKEVLVASCNIPFYTSKSYRVKVRDHKGIDGFFSTAMTRFGCPPTSDDVHDGMDTLGKLCSSVKHASWKKNDEHAQSSIPDVLIIPFNRNEIRSLRYISHCENRIISPHLRGYLDGFNIYERELLSSFYNTLTPVGRCDVGIEGDEPDKVSKIRRIRNQPIVRIPTVDSFDDMPSLGVSKLSDDDLLTVDLEEKLSKDNYSKPRKLLKAALRPPSDEAISHIYRNGQIDAYIWILLEHRKQQLNQFASSQTV